MQSITSRDNDRVKMARHLASDTKLRQQEGLFFAEGVRLCLDLASSLPCQVAFFTKKVLAEHPEVETLAPETFLVGDSVAEKLANAKNPQGLFCLFSLPKVLLNDLDATKGTLILEEIQDPANVGAMLRSAAAFGFGGVVLVGACADVFAPKALRASMGAAARIPTIRFADIEEIAGWLRQAGVALYASALQQARPVSQVKPRRPFALLIGNEGAGLSPAALSTADEKVYIPMHAGVDSLNAGAAAAVLMFAFSQEA